MIDMPTDMTRTTLTSSSSGYAPITLTHTLSGVSIAQPNLSTLDRGAIVAIPLDLIPEVIAELSKAIQ